ncbi:MAG: Hsp20/alpha crystallin family protein [Gemmatimonadetes bacterium]|nr:Hsp20/alpha crystallin family protein [Gemmatimonadota bacterium]
MPLLAPRRRTAWLSPWGDLDLFEERMRRMLSSWLPPMVLGEPTTWAPPVELVESNGEFMLTAELRGLGPGDVEVKVEEDMLTLKGEKKAEHEVREEEEHRYVWERCYGAFERSFALPRSVDPGAIRAEFKNGILTVHLPKTPVAKGRKVEIAAKEEK